MRKISLDIAHAFKGGNKRSISNTSTDGIDVYLHGNIIACWNIQGHLEVSLCNWPTQTTRERINTLFYVLDMPFRVFQKDHNSYLKHDKGLKPLMISEIASYEFKQKGDVWHVKDQRAGFEKSMAEQYREGTNNEFIIRH